MTAGRFVQNFSRRRALVASADARAIEALAGPLARLGLTMELADGPRELDAGRDVLFLDGDLAQPPALYEPAELPPVPVVGLVGVEAPSRLKALVGAGATAFLQKPVYGGSIYSALYLAVNEFSRRAALVAAVAELEARRRQRRHVIKAVVAVMRATGLDEDAAFQVLRREATRARVSLETHCERLVAAGEAESPARRAVVAGEKTPHPRSRP